MSLFFLHAWESSFLVTRCESSHILELLLLQTGEGLCCLPVCLSAVPVGMGGTHCSPHSADFLQDEGTQRPLQTQSHGSKTMGCVWSTEKIPSDFLGMGFDLGKVSVIQPGLAKLKYPLKASDKAGESG